MSRFIRKALHHEYADEVWKQLDYRAAFYPGAPISLGDYGRMNGHHFDRISSLEEIGVPFETKADATKDRFLYVSQGNVTITTTLKGQAVPNNLTGLVKADAGLGVNFRKAHGVVLDAAGVSVESMVGLEHVCEKLQALSPEVWGPDYVFVTEVLAAESCTIFISASDDAHASLRANADIEVADLRLSNAAADFAIASSEGLSTKIVTESGMTPLFRVTTTKEAGRQVAHRELKFLHG